VVTRLSGGLTPADGSDPRTFPGIWNAAADELERGFRLVQTVTFTTSGTFTKATYPWLRAIRVRVQGAGGGGGGVPATGANQFAVASGGDAGGFAESFITNIAGLDASVTVTRGAGGAANSAADGGAGGSSSFGTVVAANGGSGGRYLSSPVAEGTTSVAAPSSSVAANGTAGDRLISGGKGLPGVGTSRFAGLQTGGAGGNSVLAPGGRGGVQNSGDVGQLGSGGGGAARSQDSVAVAGRAGGNGIVIVELFA
jgi:hypothetical protein